MIVLCIAGNELKNENYFLKKIHYKTSNPRIVLRVWLIFRLKNIQKGTYNTDSLDSFCSVSINLKRK